MFLLVHGVLILRSSAWKIKAESADSFALDLALDCRKGPVFLVTAMPLSHVSHFSYLRRQVAYHKYSPVLVGQASFLRQTSTIMHENRASFLHPAMHENSAAGNVPDRLVCVSE